MNDFYFCNDPNCELTHCAFCGIHICCVDDVSFTLCGECQIQMAKDELELRDWERYENERYWERD